MFTSLWQPKLNLYKGVGLSCVSLMHIDIKVYHVDALYVYSHNVYYVKLLI